MRYRCVITSHTNPTLSGVAKFNSILTDLMSVPRMPLRELYGQKKGPILLSIKLKDILDSEIDDILRGSRDLWSRGIVYDVFFHSFDGLDMEVDLAKKARLIFCANREIHLDLQRFSKNTISAWCPALLEGDKTPDDEKLNIFSFGMAHKIQVQYYRILRDFLVKYRIGYSLKVSTAFHEKANFGDFSLISHQLIDIFSDNIQFLGFLSDDAVNFFLNRSPLFVAFFDRGVRSNNTSIFAAMERGCAVLTNCDEYSPAWMKHGENMLDIHHIGSRNLEPDQLNKIGENGRLAVRKHADWQGLVRLLNRTASSAGSRLTSAAPVNDFVRGRVVARGKLISIVNALKKKGKKIVLTSGCFDILHVGHKRFLQKTRRFGDIVILCLNTDASVRRIKGPKRPIMNQKDRAELLLALGFVDYIVFLEEDTAADIITETKPQVYVKGGDYRGKDDGTWPEAGIVKDYGGEVKLIDLYKGRSTTNVIEKILTVKKKTK